MDEKQSSRQESDYMPNIATSDEMCLQFFMQRPCKIGEQSLMQRTVETI